jgi:hypothetical protein
MAASDLSITTTNVLAGTGGRTVTGILGEDSMTAGMSIYKKASDDNNLWRADSGDSAAAEAAGILLNGGDTGQPCVYLISGDLGLGAILTVGMRYYVSDTAGKIREDTDLVSTEFVSMIGIADTTSNLVVQILNSGVQIP